MHFVNSTSTYNTRFSSVYCEQSPDVHVLIAIHHENRRTKMTRDSQTEGRLLFLKKRSIWKTSWMCTRKHERNGTGMFFSTILTIAIFRLWQCRSSLDTWLVSCPADPVTTLKVSACWQGEGWSCSFLVRRSFDSLCSKPRSQAAVYLKLRCTRSARRIVHNSPPTGCARKIATIRKWREQAVIELARRVISIVSLNVRFTTNGISLNVRFTTNKMWDKDTTHIYAARTSNNRVGTACDLYCCLLPHCEALHTCRSGFPIATNPLFRGT